MPFKRKDSPYWQITVNGVRQSSETSDRKKAADLEHKLNSQAWEAKFFGVRFTTWDEACLDWFQKNATQRSLPLQAHIARLWNPHLRGKRLKDINGELVRNILLKRRGVDPNQVTKANNTANQYAAFVGKILRHAGQNLSFSRLPTSGGREEWLTLENWRALETVMAPDLRQIATFSLATGLRRSNVVMLQWSWVKGDSLLIPSEFTKTARTYGIPLNQTALDVLRERRHGTVVHATNAFTLNGRDVHIMQLWRDWNAAVKAADVPAIPLHGLRHTYASWMVQAGVPFEIVARLCQWKLRGMVHRYTHFDTESLRPYAEKFDTIFTRSVVQSEVSA